MSHANALLVMTNFRRQTWRHGPSPTQVDISTHLFAHVNTAGHNGFDCQLMNSWIIFTPDGRFKQSFGTAVSCRVYGHFPWKRRRNNVTKRFRLVRTPVLKDALKNLKTGSSRVLLAWENTTDIPRRHRRFPPRNDVWGTSAEIAYWWRVTTQI